VFRFRILAAKNSRNFVAAFSPALARIAGTVWAWRSQVLATTLPVLARFIFLGQMLDFTVFLVWVLRSWHLPTETPETHRRGWRIIHAIAKIGLIFSASAFLANIFGYVNLGDLLGIIFLRSVYVAVVLYSVIRIIEGLIAIALQVRPLGSLRVISLHRAMLERRTFRVLEFLAFLWWLNLVLNFFGLNHSNATLECSHNFCTHRIFRIVEPPSSLLIRGNQPTLAVQALLRQSGRSLETKLRVVSDGEDGMRSLVGKLFNANEQHILDWYHIAGRFETIGKGLVYLPHVGDFEHRLSRHWHHLNRSKWKVWHGNLYRPSIALSSFYDGVDIHVMTAEVESGRSPVEQVRELLVELCSYLTAPDTTDQLRQRIPRRPSHIDGARGIDCGPTRGLADGEEAAHALDPTRARRCCSTRAVRSLSADLAGFAWAETVS
jgi:hypothetical protein